MLLLTFRWPVKSKNIDKHPFAAGRILVGTGAPVPAKILPAANQAPHEIEGLLPTEWEYFQLNIV
jgi:hypothetical protein